jgi:hypothetical protein
LEECPVKVKFAENKSKDEFPDLTDGKTYDVDDEFDMEDGEHRYAVWDDEEDALVATPYPSAIFDVIEE